MKVKSDIKCPGCGYKTKLVFRKPGFMSDAVVENFVCECCESGIQVAFKRPKPGPDVKSDQLMVYAAVTAPSPLLERIKAEEAATETPGQGTQP